jgi:predicted lactoylglutathione lyase
MKTKQIWANLATTDLDRTTKFYTALGFKQNSGPAAQAHELTSFSIGEKGFVINFFLKNVLQKNTQTEFIDAHNATEILFSLSAESKEELEQWIEIIKSAGGKITVDISPVGPGFTFVFADPDGHKFNFLYWPGM